MQKGIGIAAWCMASMATALAAVGQEVGKAAAPDQCITCHGSAELWEKDTLRLFVGPEHLAKDIHWQKGISCQQCHGGNPNTTNLREAHADEDGFRSIKSPIEVAQLCARCHDDPAYMHERQPKARTDVVAKFLQSVHGKALREAGPAGAAGAEGPTIPQLAGPATVQAVSCSSCHSKHEIRAASDADSATNPSRLTQTCSTCHQQPQTELISGAHRQAGPKDALGVGQLLSCVACHTGEVHSMVAAKDEQSPVFMDHQVRSCGACHERELRQYDISAHGEGLHKMGLLVTAVCSNCHGAHAIFSAKDERSKLHPTMVATTCAACHRFIAERLDVSVHGQGPQAAKPARRMAAVKDGQAKPNCISCHQGHDLPRPDSLLFRSHSADRCGACHEELRSRYAMSMHGQLADLGFGPAARCSDCHGAHDILPSTNPLSTLAANNRLHTCAQCHTNATANFADYDPHANHHDAKTYPLLNIVYRSMEILLYSVFVFFGIHTLLWLIRSWIHRVRHGCPPPIVPREKAIMRFAPFHRWLHAVVIVSFLGLALTGLPLKYSSEAWAQSLASALGGFGTTAVLHHLCAVLTFGYFAVHLTWMGQQIAAARRQGKPWKAIFFGPDSPVPTWREFKDLGRMFRWFVGAGPKPVFERWTYWEKFDYWAVFWGVGIIGVSGLLLWFPEFFCRFLPGQTLNIAKVIHSEEALLATGFIFTIHFFNTHVRAEKFPMDMSMLSGYVSEEEMAEERPEFLERMRLEGKLEAIRSKAPTRRTLWILRFCGAIALIVGLGLLVGILIGVF